MADGRDHESSSLAGRAVLAVALLVGFYVFALGIAFVLVYVPYHEFFYGAGVRIYSAGVMVLTAILIVISVFPRRDRFVPPGPRLDPDDHPKLFEELEGVARASGQEMPREVYLLPEVNAWVSQRGGVMGVGSRRVMGVGLPLLQLLTVAELRAVIAHELGHFHHGDTALGPWLYKTRSTIRRTVDSMNEAGWLDAPFRWYGKLFMRVTNAISRRQEHAADALAARLEGGGQMASALRTVSFGGPIFDAYWYDDYEPALDTGFKPPLLEGFGRIWSSRGIRARVDAGEFREIEASVYDTHPPMSERLEALAAERVTSEATADRTGISLLGDADKAEDHLVGYLVGHDAALTELAWDDVGERIYAYPIRSRAEAVAPFLGEHTFATVPFDYEELAQLGSDLLGEEGRYKLVTTLIDCALRSLEDAMLGALIARGWRIEALPGELLALRKNGHSFVPGSTLRDLFRGDLDLEQWQRDCREMGIADIQLGVSSS